jgi:hypothetical protein
LVDQPVAEQRIHPHPHRRAAWRHQQQLRCPRRQRDQPARIGRAAIIHPQQDFAPIGQIGDRRHGGQLNRRHRRGQRAAIGDFAIRGQPGAGIGHRRDTGLVERVILGRIIPMAGHLVRGAERVMRRRTRRGGGRRAVHAAGEAQNGGSQTGPA